ncbi:MAG: PA0069 family radical SAM protein [Myxococcota bacterium]
MFRPASNPPSRFEELHVTWDAEAPPARLRVYDDDTRGILAKNESPDIPFTWSVNPYRGCSHACIYCYARPSHEYLGFGAGTDFDTRILVKREAPRLLAEAFDAPSWQGERILFSGNTDCYQPLEHRLGLTRGCLEVCARYRNPVSIITKSNLIERDVALIAGLAQPRVTVSIPYFDPALARAIEPGAPTPARRLRALRTLSSAGIAVGVNVAPVIPGVNDKEIPAVLKAAREAGARWAGIITVRLPGPVAPYFEQRLAEALPLRAASVMARIRRARDGKLNDPRFGSRMKGTGEEWEATQQLFDVWTKKLGYEPWVRDDGPSPFRRPGEGRQMRLL